MTDPSANRTQSCCPVPAAPAQSAARRKARIANGHRQKLDESNSWPGYAPTRSQILIPLLATISAAGVQKPAAAAEAVADMLAVPHEIRTATASFNGKHSNLWHRTVRWAIQDARRHGWINAEQRGEWSLTEAGNNALGRVSPETSVIVFRTNLGRAFAALAENATAIVENNSVQTLFTSPLFPLASKNMKSYGTMEPSTWLPWMIELLAAWLPLLRDDGIIAIHLGATHYRGLPAISSYRERFVLAAQDDLGLFRMPDLFWENPSRLPNLEWGAIRGMTPRPTVDPIYLLSKTAFPYLNAGSMRLERNKPPEAPARGQEKRPSGLTFGATSFSSTKTPFPSALIRAGGSSGAETWRKNLKASGLTPHPCPMPLSVPKFVIEMTSRHNDLIFDPFFGSGTTGAAAEELGRRWIGVDHHRQFLHGAALRPEFLTTAGYVMSPRNPS